MALMPAVRASLAERFIFNFRLPAEMLATYLPVSWLENWCRRGFVRRLQHSRSVASRLVPSKVGDSTAGRRWKQSGGASNSRAASLRVLTQSTFPGFCPAHKNLRRHSEACEWPRRQSGLLRIEQC